MDSLLGETEPNISNTVEPSPIATPISPENTQSQKQAYSPKVIELPQPGEGDDEADLRDVTIISDIAHNTHQSMPIGGYIPIDSINIAVDMDNKTIRQIIDNIVGQASSKTGDWRVKWRLRKDMNTF